MLAVIHNIYRRETGYGNDASTLMNDTCIEEQEQKRKTDVGKLRDTVFVTNNQANFSFLLVSIVKRQLIEAPISPPPTYPQCSFCRLFPYYCYKRKRAPE